MTGVKGYYRACNDSEVVIVDAIVQLLYVQASFNEGEFLGGVMTVASAIGSFLYMAELSEENMNKILEAISVNIRMGYNAQKPNKSN